MTADYLRTVAHSLLAGPRGQAPTVSAKPEVTAGRRHVPAAVTAGRCHAYL